MDLTVFHHKNLFEAGTDLFKQLNISLNSNTTISLDLKENVLKEHFKAKDIFSNVTETYFLGLVDDAVFDMLHTPLSFQEADKKINNDYNGLMVFAVNVRLNDNNKPPTRSDIADLTRAFNRASKFMPVVLLVKYGNLLAFSTSERMKYQQTWRPGEKIGKVSMLKDIDILKTHAGHSRILEDLIVNSKIKNFNGLYEQWKQVFSIQILNKRFYQEISYWYFRATAHVSFPDDIKKDKNIRNADSLIRLITRIIFIWFIKEKQLVPDTLFDPSQLSRILKEFAKNKESHSYYQAILQNLFFGTLNQKMDERGFAEDTEKYVKGDHGVKSLFRYKELFSISEKEVLALFADIPFLNGGLFDCLDKDNPDIGKHQFVDGFSRNPKKRAIVPDFLFFHAEEECDLNAIYGTKNKTYKVKGLFDILSAYKFTITENTPIEEEIALDPELLGKVFENLLASYNPETQTTARKQTGSFYTPREIVNYMVDESIKAYFKQKLETDAGMKPEDAETGLELLLGYNDKEHLFDKKQTAALIKAIDNCKILDPACGSGAFPMGVLHKLVYSLYKLDPNNEKWREIQRQKAIKETEAAFRIGNKQEREERLIEISDVFENNSDDYGRKLYLIENCIYGVDIQPIAIQISKLRFFISLIVDQKVNHQKDNFGIRALPNLETKFVAANTLIGLDKPSQLGLKNPEINTLEDELKKLRHQYFSAKTRKEKLDCQKKDKGLREKISVLLVKDGWDNESAKQLSAFDPYNQNAGSTWFDAVWMFGIKDGFDIVIGNPPYVRQEQIGEQKAILLEAFKDAGTGKSDLYVYFYVKGLQLLNNQGIECLICSNSWLDVGYGAKLQEFLLKNYSIKAIVHSAVERQFETAAVNTVISFIENTKPGAASETRFVTFKDTLDNALADKTLQREIVRTRDQLWRDGADESGKKYEGDKWGGKYLRAPDIFYTILAKGKGKLIKLGDIADVRRGFTSGANEFFYLDDENIRTWGIEKEFLQPVIKSPKECKKIVLDPNETKFKLFMCHKDRHELAGTSALKYIRWGEEQQFHQRPSCKGRARWWDLGMREGARVNCNYLVDKVMRFFCYEKPFFVSDNFQEIHSMIDVNSLTIACNSSISQLYINITGRSNFGDGLLKIQTYEVADIIIPNPQNLDISNCITVIEQSKMLNHGETDRRALDDMVFDVLGLTSGECEAIYEALIQLVEQRLKKAKSI